MIFVRCGAMSGNAAAAAAAMIVSCCCHWNHFMAAELNLIIDNMIHGRRQRCQHCQHVASVASVASVAMKRLKRRAGAA